MMTQAAPTQPTHPALAFGEGGLVPQPQRHSQFPIRVPVLADSGGHVLRAEILGSTDNVLLLQARADAALPGLGAPVRMRVDWDQQVIVGRIAAHGVASRFLVTIGERAIRRSRRFPVDLPGMARSAHLYGPTQVRIVDLSTGGARIEGLALPVGSELELLFTPPGKSAPMNVLAFVVRAIDTAEVPTLGIAFRMAQPSIDALAP
jgi:hypothetical protein